MVLLQSVGKYSFGQLSHNGVSLLQKYNISSAENTKLPKVLLHQNITLHASPSQSNSALLSSAFMVHSTAFFQIFSNIKHVSCTLNLTFTCDLMKCVLPQIMIFTADCTLKYQRGGEGECLEYVNN